MVKDDAVYDNARQRSIGMIPQHGAPAHGRRLVRSAEGWKRLAPTVVATGATSAAA